MFFISAITWHDIQQLSINLPEFTQLWTDKTIHVKNYAIDLKKNSLYICLDKNFLDPSFTPLFGVANVFLRVIELLALIKTNCNKITDIQRQLKREYNEAEVFKKF